MESIEAIKSEKKSFRSKFIFAYIILGILWLFGLISSSASYYLSYLPNQEVSLKEIDFVISCSYLRKDPDEMSIKQKYYLLQENPLLDYKSATYLNRYGLNVEFASDYIKYTDFSSYYFGTGPAALYAINYILIAAIGVLNIIYLIDKKTELSINNGIVSITNLFGSPKKIKLCDVTDVKLEKFGGLTITTNDTKQKMYLLKNNSELKKAIEEMPREYKEEIDVSVVSEVVPCSATAVTSNITPVNNALPIANQVEIVESLKKYKELLDMGALTQEEFEAKKKQLLGL